MPTSFMLAFLLVPMFTHGSFADVEKLMASFLSAETSTSIQLTQNNEHPH
jgi:hypothetical protein